MTKILIVDDERSISDIIKFNVRKEGMDAITAADGEEALAIFELEKPDLVLLDVMLPKVDGIDVAREIRKHSQIPIIMVSAKDSEIDKVVGLNIGADDYVTKPFSNAELIARIKANLRRSFNDANIRATYDYTKEIDFRDFLIVPEKFECYKGEELLDLTHREFELLHFLAMHMGETMSREALLRQVWGYDYFGDARTVDVTVRRLREKIEDDPSRPMVIKTKRGAGYYIPFGYEVAEDYDEFNHR